jgi:DNA-binding CsgD family transcriptional regulator
MGNEQLLARLIGRLYDAGLGADSWDSALDDVMHAVSAEVSALFVEDRSHAPMAVDVFSLRGYPDHVPVTYASYFAERDVRMPAVLALPAGATYVDDRSMPFAQIERSEIYHDFYRPIGVAYGMATIPFNDGTRFGILSAHRAIEAGNFQPQDIAIFERIAPHLTRALRLQRQVHRANAVADGLAAALNHFQMAVLLVNEDREVIELNLAAESLLRQPNCPLRIATKHLAAASSADSARMTQAIANAADISRDRITTAPPVLRLTKTDGSGTLSIMVAPARRPGKLVMPGERLVLVFVSDPAQTPQTLPSLLTSQFGLSPTEAQVAARLAAGDRIEDIAETRGVSQETVRVQVKRVLAKTDTRSQGQLIGFISRSLAALRR